MMTNHDIDRLILPADFDLADLGDIDLSDLELDPAGFDLADLGQSDAVATDTTKSQRGDQLWQDLQEPTRKAA